MNLHVGLITIALAASVVPAPGHGPAQPQPQDMEIPAEAIALEGIPAIRIDSGERDTTRRVLSAAETAKDRLVVKIVDGQFYWTSRDNRRLRLDASGPFTYLSAAPGHYIRMTRVNDRLSYVEHVDTALGSVTRWGELRIIVGK